MPSASISRGTVSMTRTRLCTRTSLAERRETMTATAIRNSTRWSTGNQWNSTEEAQRAGVGDRAQAGRRRGPADPLAQPHRDLLAALCERLHPDGQQRLQRLAHGRRLARQIAVLGSDNGKISSL